MPASSDGRFAPQGRIRALLYRLVWIWMSGLQKLSSASLYVGAGMLRPADLRLAALRRWEGFRVSADEVDAGLEGWEDRLYSSVLRPGDAVLLLGSGACRDLIPLRLLGHDVTGVEQVPELNVIAGQHLVRHGVSATLLTGSAETVDLQGPYDVVIFSSFSYGYLLGIASRVAALSRLRAHLSTEGRLVISYIPIRMQSRFWIRLTQIAARLCRSGWRPEDGDVFYPAELEARIPCYEHRFAPGEVQAECEAAGLRTIRDEEIESFRGVVAVASSAVYSRSDRD